MVRLKLVLAVSVFYCTASFGRSAEAENLADAWAVARGVDQQLEASQWRSSAAQRGLYAARAERWPSINAQAGYHVYDNPITYVAPVVLPTGNTASFDITQREALLAGVHVRQPLYTFGRIRSGIDAAGAELTSAVADEARTELEVRLHVAHAYINVLHAHRNVQVAVRAVESLASHGQDVRNRLDQGVGIRNNLLAAEVALANVQQARLQTDAVLDIANAAYNRALQRPLDSPVELEELAEPVGQYDLESLTVQALAQRPEIGALSADVRVLRSRAQQVRAGYRPQFHIDGGFDHIENRFLDNNTYNSISVIGEWNVFDTGRKRHTAAKLEQNAEALLRQRTDIETRIALQVRDAWRRLETSRERVQVNRVTIQSSEENLTVAKNRYNQGVGTNTEVLDAETLRTRTYSNYYSSLYDAVAALMELSRAIGDFGLSAEEIAEN